MVRLTRVPRLERPRAPVPVAAVGPAEADEGAVGAVGVRGGGVVPRPDWRGSACAASAAGLPTVARPRGGGT